MLWSRERRFIAFDARSICGAVVRRGRLIACHSRALPPASLAPAPTESNLARLAELREALRSLVAELPARTRRVELILPAGLVRPVLVASNGDPRDDRTRFKLAPGLPFPASEAIVDGLRLGTGQVLAAAARRRVVAEYEDLCASVGLETGRIDFAPLAALAALLRRPLPAGSVDVILGDASFSAAVWGAGSLLEFHSRWRDTSLPAADEIARLWEEVERLLAGAAHGAGPAGVRAVGSGARTLAQHAADVGRSVTLGWELPASAGPVDAAELAWLGAALA